MGGNLLWEHFFVGATLQAPLLGWELREHWWVVGWLALAGVGRRLQVPAPKYPTLVQNHRRLLAGHWPRTGLEKPLK